MALSAEVRETLARHGLSTSDIDAVEAFEASQDKPRKREKIEQNPLDFGDWQA